MYLIEDLTDKTFGKGKVIERVAKPLHLKRTAAYWLVRCECGQECVVDTTSLKRKWTNCGCDKDKDLTGKRFHSGVVECCLGSDELGRRVWELKCDCGNFYQSITQSLTSDNTKSCGCLNHKIGKHHPHYKGVGDLSGNYWTKLKRGARTRGLDFKVTMKAAWKLYLKQDKKCALTGWPITLSDTKHLEQTASLDRVDSDDGYKKNNIQWVHKDINRVKQNFSEPYLISMCEAIISHRRPTLDSTISPTE